MIASHQKFQQSEEMDRTENVCTGDQGSTQKNENEPGSSFELDT